ncbi:MAG TPA: erythromycin esterase family protein [Roseiflexaceae bacterium]|nr:erythromycin esterase family protein [Roseiflexaceae bacterium]
MASDELINTVRAAAQPLAGTDGPFDEVLDLIGDARVVLLGEASHGTHEFYQARAAITRRLIAERGFTAVVAEADWPDAYRVNCYVRGAGDDATAEQALGGFRRFPIWMWRNMVVHDFVEWQRAHNAALPTETRAGFYGMDLYSLYSSIEAVVSYLERTNPAAARRARQRYACLEQFGEDAQQYGYFASYGDETCEEEAVAQLLELQRQAGELARSDNTGAEDMHFYAEQNARLVKNAEEYYRAMFRGRDESWNLRDSHMVETVEALLEHLGRGGRPAKAVLWAHNSHLGDARATEMSRRGELNVGQLVRQRFGKEAALVGFSTYSGTVTAADDWDMPHRRKHVRPALEESYEALFHQVGLPAFLLDLRGGPAAEALRAPRLERAIGVIYRPQTERASHYFYARLADQFDALLHFDQTSALMPLERSVGEPSDEPAETFPFGE